MTCQKILSLLPAHLDGELAPAEQRLLDAHLASCQGCRAALAELSQTWDDLYGFLREELQAVAPRADAWARISADLGHGRPSRPAQGIAASNGHGTSEQPRARFTPREPFAPATPTLQPQFSRPATQQAGAARARGAPDQARRPGLLRRAFPLLALLLAGLFLAGLLLRPRPSGMTVSQPSATADPATTQEPPRATEPFATDGPPVPTESIDQTTPYGATIEEALRLALKADPNHERQQLREPTIYAMQPYDRYEPGMLVLYSYGYQRYEQELVVFGLGLISKFEERWLATNSREIERVAGQPLLPNELIELSIYGPNSFSDTSDIALVLGGFISDERIHEIEAVFKDDTTQRIPVVGNVYLQDLGGKKLARVRWLDAGGGVLGEDDMTNRPDIISPYPLPDAPPGSDSVQAALSWDMLGSLSMFAGQALYTRQMPTYLSMAAAQGGELVLYRIEPWSPMEGKISSVALGLAYEQVVPGGWRLKANKLGMKRPPEETPPPIDVVSLNYEPAPGVLQQAVGIAVSDEQLRSVEVHFSNGEVDTLMLEEIMLPGSEGKKYGGAFIVSRPGKQVQELRGLDEAGTQIVSYPVER